MKQDLHYKLVLYYFISSQMYNIRIHFLVRNEHFRSKSVFQIHVDYEKAPSSKNI